MAILVTGATGLLGNNIVRQLLEMEESVCVLTRAAKPDRSLENLNVQISTGDVRDRAAVRAAMQGVEAVIHSAGHVHIGWSQQELHRSINVEGTKNVAEAARDLQIRMVHVSAVNALGISTQYETVDEDTVLPGIVPCPYAVTKREAELLVLGMARSGLNAVVVNPAFMLGPWDWKPSSGRMMLEVARRFTPLAPIGSFSVCDARDVTGGVLSALNRGQIGRRYILGGHNLSYFELWKKFAALAGKRGPLFKAGPMQRLVGGAWGDLMYRLTGKEPDLNSAGVGLSGQHHLFRSNRAIAELGYRIRPLEETLRDTWAWFQAHGYVK